MGYKGRSGGHIEHCCACNTEKHKQWGTLIHKLLVLSIMFMVRSVGAKLLLRACVASSHECSSATVCDAPLHTAIVVAVTQQQQSCSCSKDSLSITSISIATSLLNANLLNHAILL
eukprot:18298-Heterococcus_DN1.PRE.1